MLKFKVNQYIELKFDGEKTQIYINGIFFRLCKFLLINIPVSKTSYLSEIESIDEVAEKIGHTGSYKPIPPEVEYWGHCSNLQVWIEHEYDTRLLHSSLAFPLLKELAKYDPIAKCSLKEEIAKRFLTGCPSVMLYILEEDYLMHLDEEELDTLIENLDFNRFIEDSYQLENNIASFLLEELFGSAYETFLEKWEHRKLMRRASYINKIIKKSGLTKKGILKIAEGKIKQLKELIDLDDALYIIAAESEKGVNLNQAK